MADNAHISQFISTQRGFGRTDAQIVQALSSVTDEIEDIDDLRAFVATQDARPDDYESRVMLTNWARYVHTGYEVDDDWKTRRPPPRLPGGVDKKWDIGTLQTGIDAYQGGGLGPVVRRRLSELPVSRQPPPPPPAPSQPPPQSIVGKPTVPNLPTPLLPGRPFGHPGSGGRHVPDRPTVLVDDAESRGWLPDLVVGAITDVDRAVNVMLGGDDETISARVGRREGLVEGVIADALDWFDPGHTAGAIRSQAKRSGNWLPRVPVSTARALARKVAKACCYCR